MSLRQLEGLLGCTRDELDNLKLNVQSHLSNAGLLGGTMSSVAKKEAITLILSPLELEAHGIPRRDDASRIVILVRLAQIVNNTLRKSAKRDATIEIQRRTEKKTGAEENR